MTHRTLSYQKSKLSFDIEGVLDSLTNSGYFVLVCKDSLSKQSSDIQGVRLKELQQALMGLKELTLYCGGGG
jgi:hypothetical protein